MINYEPLITVAMPVYNAGKYLRLAVLSIVNQSYSNWEWLIIDDGSSDDSFLSIADINDSRMTIYRDGVNRGLAARLNEAIDLAKGDYFARMDGDDISYPDRFLKQVTELQKNLNLDLVATRAITINENNLATGLFPYAISHSEICARPWNGFYLPHPTWMGKTEWFRKYHYSFPAPYCCEDQELLLRSYQNSHFETLNETLLAYRVRYKLNIPKLIQTRFAVFKIQFNHFTHLKLWRFLFLASITFISKIIYDFIKLISNSEPQRNNISDTDILVQWNKILNTLLLTDKIS